MVYNYFCFGPDGELELDTPLNSKTVIGVKRDHEFWTLFVNYWIWKEQKLVCFLFSYVFSVAISKYYFLFIV